MITKKREVNGLESPLKVLRKRVQLTQYQLAKLIGVSTRAVQAWEGGEYQPMLTIPQIKALCRALKCSLADLPDVLGTPKRSPQEDE
jgi:putative transcriptional regulator